MKHAFATRQIALNKLMLHPDNVRAGSGSGYGAEEIAPLAANIAECGLLQPLLVAKTTLEDGEEHWGVLAGGRRLAALNTLALDEDQRGFGPRMKVVCQVVPETQSAQVTLSFAENALQLPMDALDRYEAFAAMQGKDGADVATIARRFAIAERSVKEALRLGNVHGDIRAAHRSGDLSLEALKAFDAHPDPAVQLAAFETLSSENERVQAWHVSRYFQGRFVRVGDAIGQLVLEAYKVAGGLITQDLIEEDSVLEDAELIEASLRRVLSDAADARREELGFAWSDILIEPEWDALNAYGRIYPAPRELKAEEQLKADGWAKRMEQIEAEYDGSGAEEQDLLQEEFDRLSDQIDALSNGYAEHDMGIGGVIAIWSGHSMRLQEGLVRPEHMPGEEVSPALTAEDRGPVQDRWSAKLQADMAHVRTRAVGLALAQSPDLARDYADYVLVRSVLEPHGFYNSGTTFGAEKGSSGPEEPEGSLKAIEGVFATLQGDLETDWLGMEDAPGFEAFRALDAGARSALLAFVVAEALKPDLYKPHRSHLPCVVEREALVNIRDVWTPDASYFTRLTKAALLAILKDDLAMGVQAESLAKSKKSEIVAYLDGLFATPFATLRADQRVLVDGWAPAAMRTSEVVEVIGDDQPEEGKINAEAVPVDQEQLPCASPRAA